jgi:hypothetical protein
MRLGAMLFGPHAPEAQTARLSVFSSQSHEVREAQPVQPVPTKNARILLVMYGPAADVKEKSPVERFGSDAVMYPAS